MRYLIKLLDFYIQSSIHIGLALFSLAYVTVFENDLCRHITYPCCILFGTILGYNFLKYFDVFRKGKFLSLKYYGIILVCILAVFGFYFFFKRMDIGIKIQFCIAGILVLAYPLLRKHGIVKMFWVSFVIAYLTAFVFIYQLPTYNGILALEFIKRFVFVSALMIPFEIYDSQFDKELYTLPQTVGVENAKKIGYSMLLLFVVLDFVEINTTVLIIDIVIATITAIAIYFSSVNRSRYYTSFYVESIPILWLILLVIFQ